MELIAIVTVLALIQFFLFSYLVGVQRGKHGVKAPAMSGHPEFERALRIQQNTMEQLIVFIPSLWMFANYVRPDIAAGLGLIFVIGRQIYRAAYIADPSKRTLGFATGALSMLILLLGGIGGAVMSVM